MTKLRALSMWAPIVQEWIEQAKWWQVKTEEKTIRVVLRAQQKLFRRGSEHGQA